MEPQTIIVYQTPLEWYDAISDWLDKLTELGKIKENPEDLITRGDVGALNSQLNAILEKRNANYEGRPYRIVWRS